MSSLPNSVPTSSLNTRVSLWLSSPTTGMFKDAQLLIEMMQHEDTASALKLLLPHHLNTVHLEK